MNFLSHLLPLPSLQPAHREALRAAPERLAALGYEESAVTQALGLPDLSARQPAHFAAYRCALEECGPLGSCVRFFLLQDAFPADELAAWMGQPLLETLAHLNWLEEQGGRFRSRVDLYPCLGGLFFTDTRFASFRFDHQVYSLGGDSYGLARATPRRAGRKALDVGSGCGLHAILAGRQHEHSLGVDINPRAVQFAAVNAVLNGSETVRFAREDAFAGEGYDLIVMNPPFPAAPEGVAALLGIQGGAAASPLEAPPVQRGEESLTARLVKNLDRLLAEGGVVSIYTQSPVLADQSPLQRLRSWLPPGSWGVAALQVASYSPESFLQHRLAGAADMDSEYRRWRQGYRELGVQSICSGHYYIVRGASFTHQRFIGQPFQDVSSEVSQWLTALDAFSRPVTTTVTPHPRVARIYHSPDGSLVELRPDWWNPGREFLAPSAAAVLRELPAAPHEIAERLSQPLEQIQTVLAELGQNGLVQMGQ